MLHYGTGTHQPMSMPQDLTLTTQGNGEGNGEQRVENGVNGDRSLTKDLIGATLPVVLEEVEEKEEKEEEKKMEQKDDPTTSTGLSSEKLDEVILSVQSNDEIFDLAKIREKIESKKKTKISSSKDEIRKAMAEMARIEHYPEPQYVVYANDYIEELQFYIEM